MGQPLQMRQTSVGDLSADKAEAGKVSRAADHPTQPSTEREHKDDQPANANPQVFSPRPRDVSVRHGGLSKIADRPAGSTSTTEIVA
jgi:hypothetical protein